MECIFEVVITGAGGFSATYFCTLLVCGKETCGGLSSTGSKTEGKMAGTGASLGAAKVGVIGAEHVDGTDVIGGITGGC